MLSLLLFSLQITLPIAILVLLGTFFKRIGWIDEHQICHFCQHGELQVSRHINSGDFLLQEQAASCVSFAFAEDLVNLCGILPDYGARIATDCSGYWCGAFFFQATDSRGLDIRD